MCVSLEQQIVGLEEGHIRAWMPSGRSRDIERNHHEAEGAGSGPRRARRGDCRSGKGQYQGPSPAVEDLVWQGAVYIGRSFVIRAIAYRLQEKAFGALKPSTRRLLARVAEETAAGSSPKSRSVRKAEPGTILVREWEHTPGHGAWRRSVLQGQVLPFALRDRARNHRQSLVRTAILRAPIASDGEQSWNALNHRFDAARSTPQIFRRRIGAGLQLAARPARGLRSVHQEPGR
jgi:hypothetical protein